MSGLRPENPFVPTALGPREYQQIPAAVIRMLFETWLVSNCLSLGDRVSMGVSVETRMPFLDVRLLELVMACHREQPRRRTRPEGVVAGGFEESCPTKCWPGPRRVFSRRYESGSRGSSKNTPTYCVMASSSNAGF